MLALPLLQKAVDAGASDLHLTVGHLPVMRIDGQLTDVGDAPLDAAGISSILGELASDAAVRSLESTGTADFSHSVPGLGRFRINVFRQRGSIALAIRVIPPTVPALTTLGLPPILAELARRPNGLIVVTGPTGSGKTTTLAALVDLINREQRAHIITLEDPIEYLHQHGLSLVHQREVGQDVPTFSGGLRSTLREDPDVIMVGELRDVESVETALQAAETGHLVLASLHTADAVGAAERIIDIFPTGQQQQARVQLAACLQGVVAQRLLPRIDASGRVVACEVLIATPAVRNLIREAKTHQLLSLIQTGARYGMQTMEVALRDLAAAGAIAPETR